jgi:predicted nucleic acid-binding protein
MVKKYYIDTSIWIDLIENRKGYNGEPLGNYAVKLFYKIIKNKGIIILSDVILLELKTHYNLAQINGMIAPFSNNLEKLITNKDQYQESKILSFKKNIPKGDALHAILARDNNLILVTRDRHFEKIKDIVMFYKPEELI